MDTVRSETAATWGRPYQRFRRKKRHDGETFHKQFETTIKDKGLLCKDCHKWRRWKELDTQYEVAGRAIARLWVCVCGNVLKEDIL